MKKRVLFKNLIVAGIVTFSLLGSITVFAATTLYEQKTTENIVKGVTYEKKHRLTEEGWLDLYILSIDLTNPNITVSPVNSKKDAGIRDKVANILNEANAIGGVNSAYFGMIGTHSASFGPNVSQGEIVSMDADKNHDKNQFGTFFTDVEGTANFDYFKSTMHFYADGQMHFELAGVNTVTKLEYPVYLDRNFANDTSSLDARFSGLAKIVVENGVITKISQKGEVVQIPENGFIIIMDSINADAHLQYFAVGQKGEFKIYANFDMDKIDTAISGGGVILKNGSKPADYGEMSSGRHPRTLLGLSQDGKTMKLIVADGQRSNGSNVSIGLNVDEAVGLLMAEGMYNGLNLDGGGSSIMAVKNADKDTVTTVSSPAEGSERNIMTAVGVFDDSQPGQIIDLVIKPALTRTVEGGKVNFEVFGHDENYHKINVPINEVVFDWDTEKGTINGNVYTAIGTGKNFISATYNGLVATATVDVSPIIALKANQKSITLNEGENFTIDVSGTTVDGYTASLNGSLVIEPTLGTVSGNVYTATEKGAGYIKCSYGGLSTYIKVVVGTDEKLISSFENSPELNFTAFPTTLEGIAGISTANYSEGGKGLALSYYFKQDTTTQAAYLNFTTPIAIEGEPKALLMDIKGNGTGQWVRAKIEDAYGVESVIDFSRDVNWTDWKTLKAEIPQGVTYPISLKTIYVAAITNEITDQQVMYFDNLKGQFPVSNNVEVPKDVVGTDSLSGSTAGKEEGYTYINMAGSVTSGMTSDTNLYTGGRMQVNTELGKDADISVFAGKSDIADSNGTKTIKWEKDYKVYNENNVTLVNMYAEYGGFRFTQKAQWTRFKNDVLNSANNNVVFFMDRAIDEFSDEDEAKLFHDVLVELEEAGKNIIVVASNEDEYSLTAKEGIRYFKLPNLWKEDGTLNTNFKYLRIKANSNTVTYEVVDMFS